MPLNFPTTTKSRISFGPARLFYGASGATPTTDIGAIGDNGVQVEITSETADIMQGNPRIVELSYTQAQGIVIAVTSIEWNVNALQYGLGSGNTTISASQEVLAWGGDPCMDEIAIHVQHRKCTATHTVNLYLWKAVSEAGSVSFGFQQEAHAFEYRWKGLRSATNWAGASLASDEQLFSVVIQLT